MIQSSEKSTLYLTELSEIRQAVNGTRRKPATAKNEDRELIDACQQFEEVFLRILLKEANLNRSLLDQNESGSQIYQDLIGESLAKSIAKAGGLGLADVLYEQLCKGKNAVGDSIEANKLNLDNYPVQIKDK